MQAYKYAPLKEDEEQVQLLAQLPRQVCFLHTCMLSIGPECSVLIDLFGELIGVMWTVTVALLTSDLSAPCRFILCSAYYFQASFFSQYEVMLKHIIETHTKKSRAISQHNHLSFKKKKKTLFLPYHWRSWSLWYDRLRITEPFDHVTLLSSVFFVVSRVHDILILKSMCFRIISSLSQSGFTLGAS